MDDAPEGKGPEKAPTEAARPTFGARVRGVLRRVLTLLVSLTIAIALGECAVRLTGKHFEASLHTPDPDLGWDFRAGARGWTVGEGQEYIVINSDGNRDREHTIDKPPGTLRIAVIGDSFPAAYSVAIEAAFWGVLESKLNECPALGGRKVEVLNFGVGGFGQAQELIMLRKKVWKYDPDIVLLSFFGGNDMLDNEREVAPHKSNEPPYYLLQGDQLVLDDAFKKKVPGAAPLAVRNAFADVMNRVNLFLLVKMAAAAPTRARHKPAGGRPKDLGYPDRLAFMPPTEPAMIRAWQVTEALLRQIHSEVKAKGKDFRIMIISSPQQVHPDLTEREAFMKELQIDNLFYVEERLAKLAAKEGFPLFSTSQPLAEYTLKNKVFAHGFANSIPWGGHWNHLGNRLAGEWLAEDYCKRLSEPKPAPPPP
jgi:hypothetical protein